MYVTGPGTTTRAGTRGGDWRGRGRVIKLIPGTRTDPVSYMDPSDDESNTGYLVANLEFCDV